MRLPDLEQHQAGECMGTTQTKWRDAYSLIAALAFLTALYFIYKNSDNALQNWYWLMGLFVLVPLLCS